MALSRPENLYILAAQLSPKIGKKKRQTSPPSPTKTKIFFDAETVQKEAKKAAIKKISELLQRPDQLDKIEHLTKTIQRRKIMVESLLKSMIQSYLEGVHNALVQLQTSQKDITLVKERLHVIRETYKDVAPLVSKLKYVKEESRNHSQYATAVDNLKHIFNVPEIIKKANMYLAEGKLLHAHQCIQDLENSRDDLLFELHKLPSPNIIDIQMIHRYYEDCANLNELMLKQLLLVADRLILTARKEPSLVVTLARIIEREERSDAFIKSRADATGFNPPGRPKEYKLKFLKVIESSIQNSLEGTQCEDKEVSKVWLVKHLEIIRIKYLDDLRVIKKILPPLFPEQYNIFRVMTDLYHNALSKRLEELVDDGIQGNDIIMLLQWAQDYTGKELLGHPDLNIANLDFPPLLSQTTSDALIAKYLQNMQSTVETWVTNLVSTDTKDWNLDKEPDKAEGIYYITQMPNDIYNLCAQNIEVARLVNQILTTRLLHLFVTQMTDFATLYSASLSSYCSAHLKDRALPPYYVHYVVAIANNCQRMIDNMHALRNKAIDAQDQDDMDRLTLQVKYNQLGTRMNHTADKACGYVLNEVLMDLEPQIQRLLTNEWMTDRTIDGTIRATFDDYSNDFVHLLPQYYVKLLNEAEMRLTFEYVKALLKRPVFKIYEERRDAGEKLASEANALIELFHDLRSKPIKKFNLHVKPESYEAYHLSLPIHLSPHGPPVSPAHKNASPHIHTAGSPTFKNASLTKTISPNQASSAFSGAVNSPFALLSLLAEILKLRDASFLTFELSTLCSRYKDVSAENVIQLLTLREDMTRDKIRKLILDIPGLGDSLAANDQKASSNLLGTGTNLLVQAAKGVIPEKLIGSSPSNYNLGQSSTLDLSSTSPGHIFSTSPASLSPKMPPSFIQPERSVFSRINFKSAAQPFQGTALDYSPESK